MKSIKPFLLLACLVLPTLASVAQLNSRTEPADQSLDPFQFRRFPCAGENIFQEDFNQSLSLPAGWTVLDFDGLAPNNNILERVSQPGWQPIVDYLAPGDNNDNFSFASPSWYQDTAGQSEDWLISPQIRLTDNVCLSWFAYSQDRNFRESYEVWISTTGKDTADFFASDTLPLFSIDAESPFLNFRSVNLAKYADQLVYIAFRHTSKDKFVLVLDDIRLDQVESNDIGAVEISLTNFNEIDTVYQVNAAIRNYGSNTVGFDSSLVLSYRINQDSVKEMILAQNISILPNDTLTFTHDSLWVRPNRGFHQVCVWTTSVADSNANNDTMCVVLPLGISTSNRPLISDQEIRVYPNPVQHTLSIEVELLGAFEAVLWDPRGTQVKQVSQAYRELEMDLSALPAGIYLLQVIDEQDRQYLQKIIKR